MKIKIELVLPTDIHKTRLLIIFMRSKHLEFERQQNVLKHQIHFRYLLFFRERDKDNLFD